MNILLPVGNFMTHFMKIQMFYNIKKNFRDSLTFQYI